MEQISLRIDNNVKKDSELSIDPFYSESNIRYLEKKMEDYRTGQLSFAKHDLIEE